MFLHTGHFQSLILVIAAISALVRCQVNSKIPEVSTEPSTTTTAKPKLEMTVSGSADSSLSPKQRLRQKLMRNYDSTIHPVEDHTQPVVVSMGMSLIHFNIEERLSIITVDGWMRFSWKDPGLTWDPQEFGNVTQMHFNCHEVWKPDIYLYNSADEASVNHYGETHVLVEYDGSVLWVPPGHFKAFCRLNLRSWPFDTQQCNLKFGSWTSHGNQIDLASYRNNSFAELLNVYTDNREWKIVNRVEVEKNNRYYACCDEPYPDVTFIFKLQRDSPAYRAIVVLPCLVIMLMTGCSFLLTPTSGEKLLINSVAILCSILYLLYFAHTLPFNRSEVPIIVTFYSNITALVGIAILLNVVCMSMARERKYSSPPKFLKNLFAGPLGKLLCLGNYYHQVSSTHQRLVVELTDMAESEQQAESQDNEGQGHDMACQRTMIDSNSIIMRDWILVSAGLERLFFSIYALAFAVITSVYV